jgi:hypothetical protein
MAAAVLSLLMGRWAALTIILVRLFYNAISGFRQKRKASDALAALKAGMAPKATALRDGKFGAIDAKEAVPGDVLRIKLGDEGYSGSIAKKGEMDAVVIATGNNTFFGRTASLVSTRQQGRVPFGEGYRAGRRLPDLLLDRALHPPGALRTLSRHRGAVRVAMGGHGRHRPNGAGPADRLHPGGGADDDHGHKLPRGPRRWRGRRPSSRGSRP